MMSAARPADLSTRLLLATLALAFLPLAGCSFAPVQTDPQAGSVPAQIGEGANASAGSTQFDPDADAGAAIQEADADFGADAARHAVNMVGVPYRYGGNTPRGFDCSGLVQYSYALAGMQLPRNTKGQRAISQPVKRRELRPGDLLFFHLEGRHNSHVGVYIGDGEFVHAPRTGKFVSTASLRNPFWRKHLSGARRPDI